MATPDPRDYQGIDATIKNVARSVHNQLAMFIISYKEVLLFIKDLKTKGLLSEGMIKYTNAIDSDEKYKAFINAIVADSDIQKLNAESASNQFEMQTRGMTGRTRVQRQAAKDDLNDYRVRELISEYLDQFLDQLAHMGVQKNWWLGLDKDIKEHVIKLIFGPTFTQQAIAISFDEVFNDIQKIANEKYANEEEDEEVPDATNNDDAPEQDNDNQADNTPEQSQQDADPNYDNDKLLKAIEPLVKHFRGIQTESKLIFEGSSDLKTQAKNAFGRWTNSLLTIKFIEIYKFIKKFDKELEKIEKAKLDSKSQKIKAYKWMQHVMGKTTDGETLGGLKSDDFKRFYNAFKKYNKELQDRYNEFKRTRPKLDDPPIIPEGRIKREKVLNEMRIKIKESARSQQLAQGPLSGALVAKLTALDDEFIDYYRRFLIIHNKLKDMPTHYNFTNLEDEMLIDFMNNMLAQLLLPLQEYESLEKPISWPEVMVGYEKLLLTVQNLFALDDNFDERKAIQLIEKFKREYQAFLHDVFNMAKSSKVRGQTLKLSELKSLIKQELKVLNGKKMVRN